MALVGVALIAGGDVESACIVDVEPGVGLVLVECVAVYLSGWVGTRVGHVGGLGEVIINNETGIIVEKENPQALANAINKFYSENSESKFSKNMSFAADKYSWQNFTNGLLDLINS